MERSEVLGKRFIDLSPSQQLDLATTLRPSSEGFTDAQRSLMADLWLLVPSERLSEVGNLNTENPYNQLGVLTTADNRSLLPVGLLTDTREGEAYSHARAFLMSLEIVEVLASEFPEPTLEA